MLDVFTRYSALWRVPRSGITDTERLFHRVPAQQISRQIYLIRNWQPPENLFRVILQFELSYAQTFTEAL